MKRSRIAGLCLIATFAASAVSTAAASGAQPEYLACGKAAKVGKAYTGAYADKTCSEVSPTHEGKYERVAPSFPAKLKGKVGKVDIYLYNPLTKAIEGHFECTSGKEAGELTSASGGTLSVSYSDCRATGGLAGPCNTPGQKSGTVVSEALASRLVWLNEGESEAGVAVTAAKAGGPVTTVQCAAGAETAELLGTMIARLTPTAEASKSETIAFDASPTTGEPEFHGYWEEGSFHAAPLVSNLKGIKEFEGVPTGQNSAFAQKGPALLIGG